MYTVLFLHFFFLSVTWQSYGLALYPPTKKKNKQDTQGEKRSHGAKKKKKCLAAQKQAVVTVGLKE